MKERVRNEETHFISSIGLFYRHVGRPTGEIETVRGFEEIGAE